LVCALTVDRSTDAARSVTLPKTENLAAMRLADLVLAVEFMDFPPPSQGSSRIPGRGLRDRLSTCRLSTYTYLDELQVKKFPGKCKKI
jgi:hypothetical protein